MTYSKKTAGETAATGVKPLRSKKRELFCRIYAGELWGDPGAALQKAGFRLSGKTGRENARKLLESEEIIARIKYLRKIRGAIFVADQTWLKERLVNIINRTEKDSDRIRAISYLNQILNAGGENPVRNTVDSAGPLKHLGGLFEGDGEETFQEGE